MGGPKGNHVFCIQMKLQPLRGYVLIDPSNEEQTTAEGLYLPEKAKDKPEKGVVLEVGEPIIHYEYGVINEDKTATNPNEMCPVKKGDKVVFHKWAGQDVREGQKEYKLVKFSDLMGVYSE